MSTTTVDKSSAVCETKTVSAECSSVSVKANCANGNGLPPLLTSMSQGECRDTTIHSPNTHISAFHQTSHELATTFSQIPWMSFSIVAKPDLNLLANNEAMIKFIHQVTDITIATVSEQIHQEITVAVNKVIKDIAGSVNKKMETTHASIMKEIVSVSAEWTATKHEKLECPPFKDLVKEITSDQKHDCPCSAETTKPAPAEPPVVKPAPIPELVVVKPATIPEPPVKPVEPPVAVKAIPAPPAKPTIVPPPAMKGASWIWTPEYKINSQPPVGTTRTFRRTIVTETPVNALTLEIAADDLYTVYVNGKLVGSGKSWIDPDRYTIRFEPTTRVVVAVVASQGAPQVVVGLIVSGKLWNTADANPCPVDFATDGKWVTLTADGVSEKFIDPTFADASWVASHVICAHGTGIWKDIKPATPGKAAGQRISGIPRIPDAPNVPVAEEWKI
ncbi:hypothetical protein BJ165DRAFT_1594727 [Panaeolus papilionaceus]|nr:hypothetical protein BJ165DRAFT_1594727 [Panaeolus papilionaceus]